MIKNISFFYSKLGAKFKKELTLTFILIILGLLLEFLSVAILIPIINLFTKDSKILETKKNIIDFFSLDISDLEFYILIILSIVIVYSFRAITLFYVYLFQNKFIQKLHKDIFMKIYNSFLNLDVLKIKELDSEKILTLLQKDLERFSAYIRDYIYLVVEILLIAVLFSILLINNPVGTFFLVIMNIPFLYAYIIYFNKKMKRWGEENVYYNQKETRVIIDTFSFFKEIKIYNIKKEFLNKIENYLRNHIDIWIKQGTLSQITRFIIETYFIFIIILYSIFSYLILGETLNDIILNVTLIFIIIIKFLPSISKIISYSHNLKYNSESFRIILSQFKNINTSSELQKKLLSKLRFNLIFEKIKFSYLNQKKLLNIKKIEFKLNERILIKGDSGSGKTTLIEIILGLIKPKNIKIFIDSKHRIRSLYSSLRVGYVKQENTLIYDTLIENIVLDTSNIDIKRYNLAKKISLIENDYNFKDDRKKIKNINQKISGGQKQRIAIARAIYFGEDVLIFDEATNSLDRKSQKIIFEQILRLKDILFIYTTHSKINYKYATRSIDIK